jgi:hypothetical protein
MADSDDRIGRGRKLFLEADILGCFQNVATISRRSSGVSMGRLTASDGFHNAARNSAKCLRVAMPTLKTGRKRTGLIAAEKIIRPRRIWSHARAMITPESKISMAVTPFLSTLPRQIARVAIPIGNGD